MDPGGEAFFMSEMTHMRQSEMGMGRPGMSRGRQFAGDGRGGGGGGQYGSAHMQHLSPGYHGPSQAYLRCLGGDAEYAGDMSEVSVCVCVCLGVLPVPLPFSCPLRVVACRPVL